jgi:hypothetical protein
MCICVHTKVAISRILFILQGGDPLDPPSPADSLPEARGEGVVLVSVMGTSVARGPKKSFCEGFGVVSCVLLSMLDAKVHEMTGARPL